MTNSMAKGVNLSPCAIMITLCVFTTVMVPVVVNGADLFPFDSHTSILEDGYDHEHSFSLSEPLSVAGQEYDTVYIGVNGYIAFTATTYAAWDAMKNPFPDVDPIIALLWDDLVDTADGAIWVHETTEETQQFADVIHNVDTEFDADWCLIVTWENIKDVFSYSTQSSFQIVLVNDLSRKKSYAIFNYNQVSYKNQHTKTGFSLGVDNVVRSLPGVEHQTLMSDLVSKSNVATPGRFVISLGGINCPPRWIREPDMESCVKVIGKKKRNFVGARKHCVDLGGDLITNIYTYEERTRFKNMIKAKGNIWIGVHYHDVDSTFAFVNGNELGPEPPFKKGRGPTEKSSHKKCVSMKRKKWIVKKCSKSLMYVCQMPVH